MSGLNSNNHRLLSLYDFIYTQPDFIHKNLTPFLSYQATS